MFNTLYRYRQSLSDFISSDEGQQFFNFAYSIGAAIVIWGALFKMLHIKSGDVLLAVGMGTEVIMFVLTAFDRPPREHNYSGGGGYSGGYVSQGESAEVSEQAQIGAPAHISGSASIPAGGSIIIGGQVSGAAYGASLQQASAAGLAATPQMAQATAEYVDQVTAISEQLQRLSETTSTLNKVSETLLNSYEAITANADNISDSSNGYVAQMQSLNQNIRGLNTIYEIQLKSVSSQLDAIDRVNRGIKDIRDMYEKSAELSARYCEETEKMARYMQQLNQVYEKMVSAMSINMNTRPNGL